MTSKGEHVDWLTATKRSSTRPVNIRSGPEILGAELRALDDSEMVNCSAPFTYLPDRFWPTDKHTLFCSSWKVGVPNMAMNCNASCHWLAHSFWPTNGQTFLLFQENRRTQHSNELLCPWWWWNPYALLLASLTHDRIILPPRLSRVGSPSIFSLEVILT